MINKIKELYNSCQRLKSDTYLEGENLEDTNLKGVDLGYAILQHSIFENTDLRGANLYGADLSGAYFYGTDLRGADLRGIKIDKETLFENIKYDMSTKIDKLTIKKSNNKNE